MGRVMLAPGKPRWASSQDHVGGSPAWLQALLATPAQDVPRMSPPTPMPCPGHSPDQQGVKGDRESGLVPHYEGQ